MRVVVFDDELGRQPAPYLQSLQSVGIEMLFCPNADDAVAVVERERPDVVLMDFVMYAERSGAEAIVALRDLRARVLPRLHIVAISTDTSANQRMLDAGADDAVPKTHLRGYLRKMLERKRLASLSLDHGSG